MVETVFHVDGMSCGGCIRRVTSALNTLPGIEVVSVAVGLARVRLDPAGTTESRVVEALENAGYAARREQPR
jgi:copper chaperone CopZ